MNIDRYLQKRFSSLKGKTVAIAGSTGGLGAVLCSYMAKLDVNMILIDRNEKRSEEHKARLLAQNSAISVQCVPADLSSMASVKAATEILKGLEIDLLIHNAGAYSVPRFKCDSGYDNVFQINFASPYYMTKELLPLLSLRGGRVIAVGSIAHNYSKTDETDIDFSTRSAASKVYGNAKRFLMFSFYGLFSGRSDVKMAVTHPGITVTNITAHYPKLIYALIKYPMKVIFMSPKKAALSILEGAVTECGYHQWIGPRIFDVWGLPSVKKLKTCSDEESKWIFSVAEEVYEWCKSV